MTSIGTNLDVKRYKSILLYAVCECFFKLFNLNFQHKFFFYIADLQGGSGLAIYAAKKQGNVKFTIA